MAEDHLRISQLPGYQNPMGNSPPPPSYKQDFKSSFETPGYLRYTRILWAFASSSLIVLNILAGFMTIRDMYNTTYNAYNHYFMTSAFAMTIGILAVVHTHILKKDN